uniref:AAA+ ATPase domain-containing protein n=1 Tax=Oryza nivara TaxID=4536 RepID=A0A0E0HVM5_ORYNI
MVVVDASEFGAEGFDPKRWINAALDARHPSEPLDRFLADAEERLRSAADDAAAALERDSADALRRVPLACRDALRLRDDAVSLRSHLASVLQSLSQAEGSSAESITALARIDTVKQRMEAAYATLQVAEFANVRKQLEVLEERLDDMVQPRLVDALSNRKRAKRVEMENLDKSTAANGDENAEVPITGRAALDIAAIRLTDLPDKSKKLFTSKDPRFHALPLTSQRVAAFSDTVNELVYDVLISKVRQRLNEVARLPIWSSVEEPGGLPLPSFSAYPQAYVTSVGEYLLTLPQQLEPLAEGISGGEAGNEEAQFFATEWIFKVAEGATALFMEQLRGIHYITDRGAQQLAADIEYLSNVLSALSMPIPPFLATFHTCISTPRDQVRDLIKSDGGSQLDLPTAHLMAPTSMSLAAKTPLPFSTLPSSGVAQRPVSVTASLEHKTNDARRKFLKLALGNLGVGLPTLLGAKRALAEEQGVSSSRMSYSRFLEYLDKDRVKKVDLFENGTIAIVEAISPELGNRVQRVRVQLPGLSQELLQKLREKNIDFAAHSNQEDSGSLLFNLIGNLAFPLILIGGLFLLSRRAQGGLGGPNGPGFPLGFGQSRAKFQMEPNTGVTFDDVAGVDEAKQDFMEVVEFLKKPERFTAVGARIPKGVLLVGPPGTGKTLLAKAIAGEAGVPFFSISGSEFVEMFVGVGASRVRDLFKKAKENAPCIVFVDEIDAVGRQRGTGIGGGNDEREQTLNQLLTEMDGFEGNTGIIVIAATNRADILDSALLRPGRFDRQVSVDVPDVRGRTEILKVHGSNKKFDTDVSLEVIAMRTPGFSGADLANLLNEAAILAGRRGRTAISSKEIDDSIDRIVAGMEGTVMTDGKSKSLVAYHEVGHAICGTLTPGHDPVQKVTLIPRGQARGLTWFIPMDDPTLISRQQLFARIVGGLGGRAAEEIIFGEPEVTTGAAGDLQQITGLAKQMVVTFGMSDIGPWSLMDSGAQSGDVIMRMMARNSMSEKLAEDIDTAVKRLSDEAYEIALSQIRSNREAMDKIVEVLLEKETLSGDEFRAILSEFTEIPVENRREVHKD